jgi:ribosomal protein S18 acetylase RimI-like enzyme
MLTSHRNAHLNLVESSRRLFELDPGAEIEAGDGYVLAAGRSTHPAISNAAFRIDDGLDPVELLARAKDFFAARGRGFAVWARAGVPEDRGLIAAAEAADLRTVHEMPEMLLDGGAPKPPTPPSGVELRQVASRADGDDYWRVATEAYADNGFPPEIFAFYENHAGLSADGAAAFLATLDGRPAAISMTIVSHGVAGIYWVGCTREARRQGLGRLMTLTAVEAGLEMGGEIASLQASPMGQKLYPGLGFETIFDYRLMMWTPEKEEQ